MIITWTGLLAVLLNKLWRTKFKIFRENYSIEKRIKRIGVYYMCIDDLPL